MFLQNRNLRKNTFQKNISQSQRHPFSVWPNKSNINRTRKTKQKYSKIINSLKKN